MYRLYLYFHYIYRCSLARPTRKETLGCHAGFAAAAREGNNLKGYKDVHLQSCSSHGQNLALTVLFLSNSLNSGNANTALLMHREREFFIGNPLVRIHFTVEMIWWIGLAPVHLSPRGSRSWLAPDPRCPVSPSKFRVYGLGLR